jgi:hypothetical protein
MDQGEELQMDSNNDNDDWREGFISMAMFQFNKPYDKVI